MTSTPLLAIAAVAVLCGFVNGQSSGYDVLIAQSKAELLSGQMDQALADSQKAIALEGNRWEAYMIAGYVLQAQKRYDEANRNRQLCRRAIIPKHRSS